MSFKASYFLPGQSKIYFVNVEFNNSTLIVKNESGLLKSYDIEACQVSTIISGIPIEIALPDKGRLEVENTIALLDKIQSIKILKKYSPYNLENKFKYFAVGLILTVVVFFASFKYVIPVMSRQVAVVVPDKLALFLDDKIEVQLDQLIFSESEINKSVKENLVKLFRENGLSHIDINFRKGNAAQANAFALAGKNIFFTDEIIELMDNDKYLLAIAYHEAGHLKRRHVLSTIIKDSFIFMLTLVYLGDLPGAADNLMQFGLLVYSHDHSRKFEKEADDYAIKELVQRGISPKCFTEGMEKLHAHYKVRSLGKKIKENETTTDKQKNNEESFTEKYKVTEKLQSVETFLNKYLSTHPSLKERTIDILKKYPDAKDCNGSTIIPEARK